jgi:cell fate regulator YaaT (PSP1 superfamily)
VYEYEQYVEARKQLPKRDKLVGTPQGEGRVIDVFPLKETVLVELDRGIQQEFPRAEIEPLEELDALRKKAKAPCAKHGDGPCDCAKDQNKPHPG